MEGERAKFGGCKPIDQPLRIVPGSSWRDPFFSLFEKSSFSAACEARESFSSGDVRAEARTLQLKATRSGLSAKSIHSSVTVKAAHFCVTERKSGRRIGGGLFGIFFLICSVMILSGVAWGAVTGSISGTVKDPADSAVPDARVTALEVNTGISHETKSNAGGYYTLPVLPVGRYDLDVRAAGFETCERQDVTLDTDAALRIDCTLKIGEISETVSVTDNALHVETVSTQSGEVIGSREMTSVPLNGRSFTDLLALQPGVAPETTIGATTAAGGAEHSRAPCSTVGDPARRPP